MIPPRSARASLVGPDIGLEYRYQTETAAVLVLSLGLALFPLEGAMEQNTLRPDVARPYETTAVVGAVTGVVCLLAVVSTVRYVTNWQDNNQTERYYRAVTGSLEREGGRVPLVDLGVPQDLLWAFGYPENTYSHVFRNLGRGRRTRRSRWTRSSSSTTPAGRRACRCRRSGRWCPPSAAATGRRRLA